MAKSKKIGFESCRPKKNSLSFVFVSLPKRGNPTTKARGFKKVWKSLNFTMDFLEARGGDYN